MRQWEYAATSASPSERFRVKEWNDVLDRFIEWCSSYKGFGNRTMGDKLLGQKVWKWLRRRLGRTIALFGMFYRPAKAVVDKGYIVPKFHEMPPARSRARRAKNVLVKILLELLSVEPPSVDSMTGNEDRILKLGLISQLEDGLEVWMPFRHNGRTGQCRCGRYRADKMRPELVQRFVHEQFLLVSLRAFMKGPR